MRIHWRFHLRKPSLRWLLFAVVFYFVFFVGIYRGFIAPLPVVHTAAVVETTEVVQPPSTAMVRPRRPLKPLPGTYNCPGLKPHAPTPETFTFQPVDRNNDITDIFSAFYDDRNAERPVVRVIGLTLREDDLFCQFSFEHHVLISDAKVEIIVGGHGRRYESVMYTCLVPYPRLVPRGVSITMSHCVARPANYLPVLTPSRSSTMSDFVVCVTPLNYNFDRFLQLTEIIEVNRLFGADKVVFYNYSSGPQVTTYLQRMRREGVVDIVPWPLPMLVDVWPPVQGHEPQVHYFAQLAALNDCLYRNMFSARHIVFTDLDEVIVPQPPYNNWQSMLRDLRSKLTKPPAMFMFRNVFFWLEWPNDRKYAAIKKVIRLNLTTLLKTRRELEMQSYSQRSKCIVVPHNVVHMGVHDVNEYIDHQQMTVFVDPSYGLLHHYRVDLGGGINHPYKIDTRMGDFAEQVIDRTWRRHESILKDGW